MLQHPSIVSLSLWLISCIAAVMMLSYLLRRSSWASFFLSWNLVFGNWSKIASRLRKKNKTLQLLYMNYWVAFVYYPDSQWTKTLCPLTLQKIQNTDFFCWSPIISPNMKIKKLWSTSGIVKGSVENFCNFRAIRNQFGCGFSFGFSWYLLSQFDRIEFFFMLYHLDKSD